MPLRTGLRHITLSLSVEPVPFTPVNGFDAERPRLTARQQRFLHAQDLSSELDQATQQRIDLIRTLQIPDQEVDTGVCLDVRGAETHPLVFDALEDRQAPTAPIELLNVRTTDGILTATIYVPERRLPSLKTKISNYGDLSRDAEGTKGSTLAIDSIEAFNLANIFSFWMEQSPLPEDKNQSFVWEAWIRKSSFQSLRNSADRLGIKISDHSLTFHECEICLLTASLNVLSIMQLVTASLMGFRYRESAPSFFTNLQTHEQAEWAENLAHRITHASNESPAVCVLDTGVFRAHQLLKPSLDASDCDSYDPSWRKDDFHGHGIEMAGLALLGDLTALLASNEPVSLNHKLESVRILPDSGENPKELYGWITQESVARAVVNAPHRKRVLCLAITNSGTNSHGRPTAWSAAIDKISMGVEADLSINDERKNLFIVSVGNIADTLKQEEYPNRNDLEPIENPAQSWNALSVGGVTFKTFSEDKDLDGWELLAAHGEISPTSRTSVSWEEKDWPIKPDIVLEGGNCVSDGLLVSHDPDLSLITTGKDAPLIFTCETSAATAQAARMAAMLQAEYPDYWPETIRGLLVHAARWDKQMFRGQIPNRMLAIDKENLLRRFGYGVPNLEIARHSASNRACLISQQFIQPFYKDAGTHSGYKDMNVHALPWPQDYLRSLGALKLKLRVTLSYFIEPNPSERIPSQKYSYVSHRLKFELQKPLETPETLRHRINRRDRPIGFESNDTSNKWLLGVNTRNKGSVVSDVWIGNAAELSEQTSIAVMPEGGWWKYRKHLKRENQKARYSLILSLESDDQEVDIYAQIQNMITPTIEIQT